MPINPFYSRFRLIVGLGLLLPAVLIAKDKDPGRRRG